MGPMRQNSKAQTGKAQFDNDRTDKDQAGKNQPGAIVLGGNFVGLGIVRSLGARGIPAWVLDADRSKSIAQFSRFTTRFIEAKEAIVDVLLREGLEHRLNGWVLFPVVDEYVEILSANREILSSIYRVTTAPIDVTRFALDKRLTYSRAHELGIAAPWTSLGSSVADIEAETIPYPVILKPALNHHFFPQTNIKALPAENASELRRGFAQMSQYIPPQEILVQERIPGGGENQFSFAALCKNGGAYASLVAQRRRQYPVDFGNASTFVETTNQPIVEAAGRRFLQSIGFDGLAEVEFKFDPRDQKYKILDVNPRTWGWHTLGKAAGIDFPYLLWRQAVGLPVAPIDTYRKAAWIREITDFVSIAKSRNRVAAIKRLLSALCTRSVTSATFSITDPAPFFAELALWVSSGISRQKKARDFLQLDPLGSRPHRSGGLEEGLAATAGRADHPTWREGDIHDADSPDVATIAVGFDASRTQDSRAAEAAIKTRR
jgi:D-aspartate ligase